MNKLSIMLGLIVLTLTTKAQWNYTGSLLETVPNVSHTIFTGPTTIQSIYGSPRLYFGESTLDKTTLRVEVDRVNRTVMYSFGSDNLTDDKLLFASYGQVSAQRPTSIINTLTLTSEGKVGVGTTTPITTFDVVGNSFISGPVGIGTSTTGSHQLAVDGSIGTRKIKIEATGWSDFVFADDYKLKSLEEVKSFVSQNNHLPDVPSEKEVLANGINAAEMSATLLQKIEELTLYLIDMDDKFASVEETIERLKAKNTALKANN